MPLAEEIRESIRSYCTNDLPGNMQWHIDQFSFISDVELRRRLGRAFFSARYIYKLMEALFAAGDEVHPFVKFQITQYASIYEAVISHLLWTRYRDHPDLKILETHKAYKPVAALANMTSLTFGDEMLHTCVQRDAKTPRKSIPFKDKVDCAVKIGFVNSEHAGDIKHIYELRNLTHIETEAEKQIEVEIDQAKKAYWRIRPFVERILAKIAEETSELS